MLLLLHFSGFIYVRRDHDSYALMLCGLLQEIRCATSTPPCHSPLLLAAMCCVVVSQKLWKFASLAFSPVLPVSHPRSISLLPIYVLDSHRRVIGISSPPHTTARLRALLYMPSKSGKNIHHRTNERSTNEPSGAAFPHRLCFPCFFSLSLAHAFPGVFSLYKKKQTRTPMWKSISSSYPRSDKNAAEKLSMCTTKRKRTKEARVRTTWPNANGCEWSACSKTPPLQVVWVEHTAAAMMREEKSFIGPRRLSAKSYYVGWWCACEEKAKGDEECCRVGWVRLRPYENNRDTRSLHTGRFVFIFSFTFQCLLRERGWERGVGWGMFLCFTWLENVRIVCRHNNRAHTWCCVGLHCATGGEFTHTRNTALFPSLSLALGNCRNETHNVFGALRYSLAWRNRVLSNKCTTFSLSHRYSRYIVIVVLCGKLHTATAAAKLCNENLSSSCRQGRWRTKLKGEHCHKSTDNCIQSGREWARRARIAMNSDTLAKTLEKPFGFYEN